MEAEDSEIIFYDKHNIHVILRHIVTKFDNPSSYSPRDLCVHTDITCCFITLLSSACLSLLEKYSG